MGGVETHARQLATGLQRRGWNVTVLATQIEGRRRGAIERIDRVAVVRTRPAMGRRRFTKWLFLPFAALAAIKLRRHIDVIFCPDLRGVGLSAIAAGWWTDVPVVLQGATPGAYSASHWDDFVRRLPIRPPARVLAVAKRVMYRLHRHAAAAVCITHLHEQEARESGIAAERIYYIPHGVDLGIFRPVSDQIRREMRRSLAWPDNERIIVFLGRLSLEKGVLDLLEAWRRLPSSRRSGTRLVLVGPDMTGHELDVGPAARAFVAEHGLSDSVLFAGATENPAMMLQASDALVQPSHWEAFPLSVIEAMSCGLPVVASFVGGMQDYLVHDANALVCPPKDPAALAEALRRLIGDADLRDRLSRASLDTVTARFDERRNLDAYERVFDEVRLRRMRPDLALPAR